MFLRKLHNARRAFWSRIAEPSWETEDQTFPPATLRALVDSAFLAGAKIGRQIGEKAASAALSDAFDEIAVEEAEIHRREQIPFPNQGKPWHAIVDHYHRNLKGRAG